MNDEFGKCLLFPHEFYDHHFKAEKLDTVYSIHNNVWNFTYYVQNLWFKTIKELDLTDAQRTALLRDIYFCAKSGQKPLIATKDSNSDYVVFNPDDYKSLSIDHSRKSEDLLEYISNRISNNSMFSTIEQSSIEFFSLNISSNEELDTILDHLIEQKLIKRHGGSEHLSISVLGYEYLSNKNVINSKNVFVAMQFKWSGSPDEDTRRLFAKSIEKACNTHNFKARTVSEAHSGYITDQIIREIRESKFVIADFTYNNHGAYFEAGYARALGKQVIHTVHESHKDNLHFDIKQINTIRWNDPEQLREALENRISALGLT